MEVFRFQVLVMSIMALALAFVVPSINAAQIPVPSPAPAPTSDGIITVDQGIAYLLMLLALVLTYIIH